jgi:two-component system phosphate regulon sensor histidine kinase PhoR
MNTYNPWFKELWRVAGFILILFTIGLLVGHVLLFLFIASLCYIGWHLYNLYRLCHWFTKTKKYQLPDAPGVWGEVFYHFYRLQKRNRKRKRKLARMLKQFQHSTAAMPDAIVVLKAGYEIEWFNKASRQLLGLKPLQDRGQQICNLIRYPAFCHYITQENNKENSIKITSPTNADKILRIHIVPYSGNRHLLIARDITQLQILEQVRRDFVANVSHELRTPLTVINGFIETMIDTEDECNNKHWQRPLLLMSQQTARMQRIVEDLLMLSRLESELTSNQTEQVAVPKMLNTLYEEARLLYGENTYHFTLDIDQNLSIYGHARELHSAFSNLLSNAIHYTPEDGNITLRWYRDEQGVHFEVCDTGEGIAPEHIPRLTERFYRVDVGRSRHQGGTGLGLAIVKHVLNHHHGQLHIASVVGEGSVFRCTFPLASIVQKAETQPVTEASTMLKDTG